MERRYRTRGIKSVQEIIYLGMAGRDERIYDSREQRKEIKFKRRKSVMCKEDR